MKEVTEGINSMLWGAPAVLIFLFTGIYFTIKLRGFQIRKPLLIFRRTLFSGRAVYGHGVSPYAAACTALSACIGTGNIVGAALAVISGGAGALFWMWVASFFGMATAYAENSLSIIYRHKTANGFVGGAMYTIRDGLSQISGMKGFAKGGSICYALFTVLASLGMGCAAQVNTACSAISSSFGISPLFIGIAFVILYAVVCGGGMKRVSSVAGVVVPVMSLLYCIAAIIVLAVNIKTLPGVLEQVLRSAFGFGAVSGGFSGAILRNSITHGIRRGVFSNEAGLGSAAAAHAASSLEKAEDAGLWGAFEVFFDTIFMCSLTALSVLCVPGVSGIDGAFETVFGSLAGKTLGVCLTLFAFSTIMGWGAYGENAAGFVFGTKTAVVYRIIFAVALFSGALGRSETVWGLSDMFNMLLSVPNIISLYALSERLEPPCGKLKVQLTGKTERLQL